jgi:hypothetical protein
MMLAERHRTGIRIGGITNGAVNLQATIFTCRPAILEDLCFRAEHQNESLMML